MGHKQIQRKIPKKKIPKKYTINASYTLIHASRHYPEIKTTVTLGNHFKIKRAKKMKLSPPSIYVTA